MPINISTFGNDAITEFIQTTPETTVGELYALLPKDTRNALAFSYVIAPLTDTTYFVARWVEIEEIARRAGPPTVRATALGDLVNLTGSDSGSDQSNAKLRDYTFDELLRLLKPVEAVEISDVTTQEAREIRDSHPAKRMLVLNGGQPSHLLVVQLLSGDDIGGDPFRRGGGAVLSIKDKTTDADRGSSTAGDGPIGVVGSSGSGSKPSNDRVFNYWLEELNDEGTGTQVKANSSLRKGLVYELKINLSRPRKDAVATTSAESLTAAEEDMAPERELYNLTLVFETSDFMVYGSSEQVLSVWKGSYSKNTASFAIEPIKDGACKATIFFFIDGKCFQQVNLSVQVGGTAANGAIKIEQSKGKTMGSALAMAGRRTLTNEVPVNLMIIKEPAAYKFILTGSGVTRATLNLSEAQIAEQIGKMRAALLGIVKIGEKDGDPPYQSEVLTIPPALHEQTLKTLAREGFLLYQRLFYGAGMGPDAKAMGDLLKKISQERSLHIEVVAERFIFPWAMLFDGDPRAEKIDPNGFWGFKHVIEYMPEFSSATPVNFVPEIRATSKLPFVFVANTHIDTELTSNNYPAVIKPQMDYFGKLDTISYSQFTTKQEFLNLLNDENAPPLIYINCHAISNMPNEGGGVTRSRIQLSDGEIDLDDLVIDAPDAGKLKNGPIVFLNACQSAELSPYLYAGLVPEMIRIGARGVIGTEVDTPSQFAADFAKQFITRFSRGNTPIGDLLLALRQEYLTKHNNVMGLVYALYSSGEVMVSYS
ncbi:MAG: hypothetical protein OHK0050_06060 [Roseiflexaceae bacterium]